MGGSSSKGPSISDQTKANKELAAYNTEMSFVDQYGPWGSTTYTKLPSKQTVKKSEAEILAEKAAALNKEGFKGGNWTPESTLAEINRQGMTFDQWYDSFGRNEGFSDTRTVTTTTPRYSQTTVLSPTEQAKQNALDGIQTSLLGLGGQQVNRIADAMGLQRQKTQQEILAEKAAALNKEGFKGGNWTPESTLAEINRQGMTFDQWYDSFGRSEGFSDMTSGGRSGENILDILGWEMPELPEVKGIDASSVWNGGGSGGYGVDEASRLKANENALKYLTLEYDDRFAQMKANLENTLAARGIRPGTTAWIRAMADFERDKNTAYERAALMAYNTGLDEWKTGANLAMQSQAQTFNQQLAALNANSALRNQQIQEQAYYRNLPLNELTALISGTSVNTPQFSGVPTSQVPFVQQQTSSNSNNWSKDLMGLAGTLGGAAINKWG